MEVANWFRPRQCPSAAAPVLGSRGRVLIVKGKVRSSNLAGMRLGFFFEFSSYCIMAEEITKIMENFVLSEIERGGSGLSLGGLYGHSLVLEMSLIGKIAGDKAANITGVRNYVNHAWNYPKRLQVSELGINLFQFRFGNSKDQMKALRGGPWLLDNQILVLQKWREGIEEEVDGKLDLPLHLISEEVDGKLDLFLLELKRLLLLKTVAKKENISN
ncbi:hypothetical protein ACH5RR_031982 [Cinchona calisaya]|uniref:DUF4283 domain-containing protein n=1 Tax=Cinchona calisaya TaxID=153742 RepID=A0ABD2YGT9_9GENT